MHLLPRSSDPNLLVGSETADDAGVYRIGKELALVETADIITPVVDDPFIFGRIAAANALSDVYAMGGKPLTAMNLVFFPACTLEIAILGEMLAGGAAALQEAGVALVGGHTVEDDELKYGVAVTGTIHPARIVRNSTARAGDSLVLTKPLGTGIVATAVKADMVSPQLAAEAVTWMTTLNGAAAEIMVACGARACTDITGFGLIGHACEMARGAGVTLRIAFARVPVMAGVRELVKDGLVPAGCYRNRDYYLGEVRGVQSAEEMLPLFDPQTSGGLLIALPQAHLDGFLKEAASRGCFAMHVGEVAERGESAIEFV